VTFLREKLEVSVNGEEDVVRVRIRVEEERENALILASFFISFTYLLPFSVSAFTSPSSHEKSRGSQGEQEGIQQGEVIAHPQGEQLSEVLFKTHCWHERIVHLIVFSFGK